MIAMVKTSLSEEILFRGFIAKRLISALGFKWGNLLQALIFGLVHLALFWILMDAKVWFLAFIFMLSAVAGYMIQYINEKFSGGSIIPGWIAHGFGNTISYFVIVFLI